MQRVECYIPLNIVYADGDNNPGIHVADIVTRKDFERGGGVQLMGPFNQIPGVTIERTIAPVVQIQVASLGEDPYAIVHHATPAAEKAVHNHFRAARLVMTKNAISLLGTKL